MREKGTICLVPTDTDSEHTQDAPLHEYAVQPEFSLHTELSISNATSDSTTKKKRSLKRLWSEVHHEQMSTYPLQQQTGDGLILALIRTRDQISADWSVTEETAQEVLQLVLVLLLHAAALFLQFGLTYHLYVTTVDGLFAPFADGVDKQIEVINRALFHDPPIALDTDNAVQKDALDLCVKQHSMGFVHLMVLSLWGARMITEVSETLNKVAILSLILPPIEGRSHIQEKHDGKGKMTIEHMSCGMKVLTHCNAGWLAFADWGSALSPVYVAFNRGLPIHVWVDETRPRNQGASLTAWELAKHGVKHTVIADNAGGHLMRMGMVDVVITGADRVTRNGDACNKIGAYLKALAAKDNEVPFYVALPSSTIDWRMKDGADIPIEQRGDDEVKYAEGLCDDGKRRKVLLTPAASSAGNWAFDVTPARLVTGLITERGLSSASEEELLKAFPEVTPTS